MLLGGKNRNKENHKTLQTTSVPITKTVDEEAYLSVTGSNISANEAALDKPRLGSVCAPVLGQKPSDAREQVT